MNYILGATQLFQPEPLGENQMDKDDRKLTIEGY